MTTLQTYRITRTTVHYVLAADAGAAADYLGEAEQRQHHPTAGGAPEYVTEPVVRRPRGNEAHYFVAPVGEDAVRVLSAMETLSGRPVTAADTVRLGREAK